MPETLAGARQRGRPQGQLARCLRVSPRPSASSAVKLTPPAAMRAAVRRVHAIPLDLPPLALSRVEVGGQRSGIRYQALEDRLCGDPRPAPRPSSFGPPSARGAGRGYLR